MGKLTESEAFISRRTTKEIGEDETILLSQAEDGDTLEHGENVLKDSS